MQAFPCRNIHAHTYIQVHSQWLHHMYNIMGQVRLLPLAYAQTEKALRGRESTTQNRLILYSAKLEEMMPQQTQVFSRQQSKELLKAITK